MPHLRKENRQLDVHSFLIFIIHIQEFSSILFCLLPLLSLSLFRHYRPPLHYPIPDSAPRRRFIPPRPHLDFTRTSF